MASEPLFEEQSDAVKVSETLCLWLRWRRQPSEGASWSRYKILAKKRRLSETNVLIVLAFYPFRDSTAIPKVHAVFEFALTAATKKIVAVSPL